MKKALLASLVLCSLSGAAHAGQDGMVILCGKAVNASTVTVVDPKTGTMHFISGNPLPLPVRSDQSCKRDVDAFIERVAAQSKEAAADHDLWMTSLGVVTVSAQEAVQGDQATPDAVQQRLKALRAAAKEFGEKSGAVNEAMSINLMLDKHKALNDDLFNFSEFLIKDASGALIVPPVISRAGDLGYQEGVGELLSLADEDFRVVQQARIVPSAPTWQSYLIRTYSTPSRPAAELLPKTDRERVEWAEYVHYGWEKGVKQMNDEYRADLSRMARDYSGLLHYGQLARAHLVTPPSVDVNATPDGGQIVRLKPFAE